MKTLLAVMLYSSVLACGTEQDQVQDEPVRCENFCKPSGIKFFEKKSNGNEICMCNHPVKE